MDFAPYKTLYSYTEQTLAAARCGEASLRAKAMLSVFRSPPGSSNTNLCDQNTEIEGETSPVNISHVCVNVHYVE